MKYLEMNYKTAQVSHDKKKSGKKGKKMYI